MELVKVIEDSATRLICILLMPEGKYRVVKKLRLKIDTHIRDFESSPRVYKRALSYAMKLARTLE